MDLLDPVTGTGAEYQGYWHRMDLAAERDAERFDRFRRMNLSIAEIWRQDMSEGLVADKLNEAWRRARERDVRLDAWRCPGVR